jgi:hypothetical protein
VINWMFRTPTRLTSVVLATCGLLLFGMIVFAVTHVPGGHPATARPSAGASPGTHQPTYTPQQQPTATFTFSDVGSSIPTAVTVVEDWLTGAPAVDAMQPAAYEAALEGPAPDGTVVSGTATVGQGGPTQQQVLVPTNRGVLLVSLEVDSNAWVVTGMVWS